MTRTVGDANSPTDITASTFLLGECVEDTAGAETCRDPSLDNPREALKGLPVVTERFDEQGVYLSTESVFYRLRTLYLGRDGRDVFHAFEAGRTSTQYDTHAGPSLSSTLVSTPAVLIEDEGTWTFSETAPFSQPSGVSVNVAVPLRASAGFATTKSESVVDPFGNQRVAVDYGCVAGVCQLDSTTGLDAEETIYSYTLPSRPEGDETGWLFRTVRSFVKGSVQTALRGETFTDYNAKGSPIEVRATLSGSLPLWRAHESSLAVAPEPASRSVDGEITLSEKAYDDFGNLLTVISPNGRCRKLSYDATEASGAEGFAQLPVTETVHVDSPGSSAEPCTGTVTLRTTAYYDRGFGKVTLVLDPTLQETVARYDALGRMTHLRKPLPNGALAEESTPWSVLVSYDLATAERPYSIVTTQVQDGEEVVPANDPPTYFTTQTYVDGMGRTRYVRSEADTSAGDDAPWIDSEFVTFDAKGAVARKYLPYFTTGPLLPSQFATVRYDAFGRQVQTADFGGVTTLVTHYHALSSDAWDAADLEADADPATNGDQPGPHYGTYASVRKDGHGRTIAATERIIVDETLEEREIRTRYFPTGEVKAITRVRMGSASPPVIRWMRYDSLGRMVLNVDPHTTDGFTDDPDVTAIPSSLRAYRYAYNDAGDMVGWSDARGCGVNYFHDRGGRLVAEDYSPCAQEHATTLPPYSVPNLSTLDGIEVYYQYDSVPNPLSVLPRPAGYSGTSSNLKGRLAAVFDRASLTYMTYDARGRVTRTDRAIAHPDILLTNLDDRYQAPWFSKEHTYDALDRVLEETTGAASPELLDASQRSATSVMYSARGSVHRVLSTYGNLVNAIDRSADGLIESMVYGDAATTTSAQGYDARRRLVTAMVSRGEPALWANPPPSYQPAPSLQGSPSFQHTLRDEGYEYDAVNNPTAINDFRDSDDWPAGSKPVSRTIGYDNLYRVTSVDYAYGATTDSWVSPFDPELSGMDDPRRPDDFPSHLTPATRPTAQTYEYDWLGSLTNSSDDLNAFWDRGMGPMRNDDANGRPYRWLDAGDSADPSWDGTGWADTGTAPADYDAAGNLRQIRVVRSGVCTNGTNNCDLRFYYYFDEVGRLYRGTRYEGATLKADLSFVYDSADNRVIKTDNTLPGTTNDAHTLYVFDSLELRRTSHDATNETYSRTVENEVPYLIANGVRVARVVYEGAADGEPRLDGTSRLHVFINIADHLGSTSTVIDRDTGELVERTTYQPYGATESDYRPARWKGFREDYRFTGKEEDQEIGLTYFGKRYLSPYLGRWLTPDPLAVHVPGQADLNLYAYVRGAALRAVDPVGLDWFEGWGAKIDSLAQKAADTIDKSTLARGISKGVDSTINHVAARVDQFVKAVKSPEVQAVASVSPAAAPMAAAVKVAWNDAKNVVQNPKEALKTVLVENPISQTALALKAAVQGDGEALGEHAVKGTIGALTLAAGDKLLSGPKGCFVAGTLVWTERGLVPIEALVPGDWVLAMPDDGSGALALRQVLETYEREPSAIFDLTLSDHQGNTDTLGVTPEHPFWSHNREWVLAGDLRPEDIVWSIERGWLKVQSIQVRPQQEPVYNLNVYTDHTYVVGPLGVWVHNQGPCSKPPAPGDKAFSSEKQALVDMAQRDKKLGITPEDIEAYKQLNDDLPDPFTKDTVRGPETHPLRTPESKPGPAQEPHAHVGPVSYIPVKDKKQ